MFVITRADIIGGAQVHVRDLSRRLVDAGHQVSIATGAYGPLTDTLQEAGVQAIEIPQLLREVDPVRDLRAVAALGRAISAFGPDLVSAHSSKAGIVGRLASAASRAPCLFTAHGWAFTDGVPRLRRTVYRGIERVAAPLATRIICVSDHDRRIGIAAGIRASRLVTIHNGMPDVPGCLRAAPGVASPVRIVMVARFDRQKDHRSLVQAVRQIEDARLELVGDGPDRQAVQAYVHEVGMEDRVQFFGQLPDVADVLARAHIFALSSRWEGFPRSTLEAMRAGLPVVVSDVGGAAEAIVDGSTGFRVPRGDVSAWRDRLALLVHDPSRRAEMGSAGRRRFESTFTFDHMFERTFDVYRSVAPSGHL